VINVGDNNVNGITFDGIGKVYFSPMASKSLFSMDASALKDKE
jgi:hypothetical protein